MPHGLPYSRNRGEATITPLKKQNIRISNLALEIDGATGVGFGSSVISGLPEGNISLLGAVFKGIFTAPTTGVDADWEGDFAIGSAPDADGSLAGGEVDIIPSTEIAAATAHVSPETRGASTNTENGTILDNTAGNLELNLNVLVDDANISIDDAAFVVDGVLSIAYIVLGDD